MDNYHRQSLLNLAYEMGITIKSDDDLIQFEYELVINGDLDESLLTDNSGEMTNIGADQQAQQLKLIQDIHKALFKTATDNKSLSEAEMVKATKARLLLNTVKAARRK
ncbi:hypothetical protein [Pedobacter sp. Leaf194]|uniref:hypothetical protein n=1 Tax=Pedobacter sp. Leaf194 TaxID=1736297 RepID=UPI0007039228|nr:hypothetical protein [Pedobacter sp. Leaf194]KQS41747.1 hypothetical protein ASG14_04670 [Pedobacter sp. Leaf194]